MTDYEREKLRDYAHSLTEEEKKVIIDIFMETQIYLKPCPCCGGMANFSAAGDAQIVCEDCGLSTALFKASFDAAEAWNKRV